MSRMRDWVDHPGYGNGRLLTRYLYGDEGRSIAALTPEARRIIPQHSFYNADDFKRDALAYAQHTREYMNGIDNQDVYESKMREYVALEKEYRVLLEKSRHVPRARIAMFSHIIAPVRPVRTSEDAFLDEDGLPPPMPSLVRSHHVDWWDQWLSYKGKRTSKKRKHPKQKRHSVRRKSKKRCVSGSGSDK